MISGRATSAAIRFEWHGIPAQGVTWCGRNAAMNPAWACISLRLARIHRSTSSRPATARLTGAESTLWLDSAAYPLDSCPPKARLGALSRGKRVGAGVQGRLKPNLPDR